MTSIVVELEGRHMPFWTPEGGTLSYTEHLIIEKYIIFDSCSRFVLSFDFDYKDFK